MTLLLLVLGSLFASHSLQQEPMTIWEAKFKHEKSLRAIEGVKSVSIGGIGKKYHLVISVDSKETGNKVLKMTGGKLEGWSVHITYSKTKKRSNKPRPNNPNCNTCICPCHKKGSTVVQPSVIDPEDPDEACDILRKLHRKKVRKGILRTGKCQQMVGWTSNREKKKWVYGNDLPRWESKEFGKGVLAYTYIKHRKGCPLRNDNFLERVKKLTPGKKD